VRDAIAHLLDDAPSAERGQHLLRVTTGDAILELLSRDAHGGALDRNVSDRSLWARHTQRLTAVRRDHGAGGGPAGRVSAHKVFDMRQLLTVC
jgi:hypothetical protein